VTPPFLIPLARAASQHKPVALREFSIEGAALFRTARNLWIDKFRSTRDPAASHSETRCLRTRTRWNDALVSNVEEIGSAHLAFPHV